MTEIGGQRPDSLQSYISGIKIPKDPHIQNLGPFRPLGAIFGAPSHTKLDFAIPLLLLWA